jgi:hypothetical protein
VHIDIDQSCGEALRELEQGDPEASTQWALIIKDLREDPWFEPSQPPYWFKRLTEKKECACQHEKGWLGWQLSWAYETSVSLFSVTQMTIFAVNVAAKEIQPDLTILARIFKR